MRAFICLFSSLISLALVAATPLTPARDIKAAAVAAILARDAAVNAGMAKRQGGTATTSAAATPACPAQASTTAKLAADVAAYSAELASNPLTMTFICQRDKCPYAKRAPEDTAEEKRDAAEKRNNTFRVNFAWGCQQDWSGVTQVLFASNVVADQPSSFALYPLTKTQPGFGYVDLPNTAAFTTYIGFGAIGIKDKVQGYNVTSLCGMIGGPLPAS